MRNIFLFLKKYSVLLLFLFLQMISLIMLFSYNDFHQTIYWSFSNELSGGINKRINVIEEFLSLKKENENLRAQNALLLEQLSVSGIAPDTSSYVEKTLLIKDSIKVAKQFNYFPAKVLSSSVFLQQNYVMLHRGSDQGVKPNMAVVGTAGLIGTVVYASKNISLVMSLINRDSKVIAVLKKGSGLGEISWDGKDPSILLLNKVPKTIKVNKGDSIVTSPYSDRFPPGILIGFVDKVDFDQETNTFKLKVKTAIDFNSVQHAFVVGNLLQPEIEQLKEKVKKE
jgi:rod shape-determining protein MreC